MTTMYNNGNNNNMYVGSSTTPHASSPSNVQYNNTHYSNSSNYQTVQSYNIVELSSATNTTLRQNINVDTLIINVWANNLYTELQHISDIIDQYNYIAMDTEFPGVVARPVGSFKNSSDYHYQTLKCNVDLLKLIQLGICLCDSNGSILPTQCVWQFNFKFSLAEDMYAQDSIELLQASGINFDRHQDYGIDITEFAELLYTSGIILNDDIQWLTFHSGYDFAYLLKLITNINMPNTEAEFFELLLIYFPCIYDMKYIMKSCDNLNGGLQKLAEMLNIERIGPQHQAGSDALLTAATFFKLKQAYFDNYIDDNKFLNILYGLGNDTQSIIPYNNTNGDKSTLRRKHVSTSVSATPVKQNSASNDENNNSSNGVSSYNTAATPTAAPPPGF